MKDWNSPELGELVAAQEAQITPEIMRPYEKLVIAGQKAALHKGPGGILYALGRRENVVLIAVRGAINMVGTLKSLAPKPPPEAAMVYASFTLLMRALDFASAAKLIEVGLWERTDTGYRVLKWAEQGNATKLQLVTTREVWRKKKAAKRPPLVAVSQDSSGEKLTSNEEKPMCPPGSLRGSPSGIPTYTSPSTSTSLSGSDLQGDARGSRALRPDEPLTDQRRADFESQTFGVPARAIEPDWQNYVDDRIAKTMLFGSDGAIDADWRKWVRRENGFAAEKRKNNRGRADTRQPLRDIEGATWLKPTGSHDL